MIYTPLTKKAMQIAYDAHHGQKDKAGIPYIFHPIHLAEQMQDETSCCAALLHDVCEDTDIDLSTCGFPAEVMDAVRLLTHNDDTPYMDYVSAIKASGNRIAIAVKTADLRHNLDATRLDVSAVNPTRLEKYKTALCLLLG